MSNVYSKYSKGIWGGSFPVAFSHVRVYTWLSTVYTWSNTVYTLSDTVYTCFLRNGTGKLPPLIRLLNLLYTLLIYQFAMYIPNCHSMRNSMGDRVSRPVRRAYNVVVYAKFWTYMYEHVYTWYEHVCTQYVHGTYQASPFTNLLSQQVFVATTEMEYGVISLFHNWQQNITQH